MDVHDSLRLHLAAPGAVETRPTCPVGFRMARYVLDDCPQVRLAKKGYSTLGGLASGEAGSDVSSSRDAPMVKKRVMMIYDRIW